MNFLRRMFRKKPAAQAAYTPTVRDRIGVTEARAKLARSDSGAMLVCAYESQEKCEQLRLEGALTLHELKSKESSLSTDRELIFYCT